MSARHPWIIFLVLLVVWGSSSSLLQAEPKKKTTSTAKKKTASTKRAAVRIRNNTPFIVTIYVSAIRAGWIRPFRTVRFNGLKVGYHRLYALSEYGTTYWGPTDVAVPGLWNLQVESGDEPADMHTALASRIFRANKSSLLACDKIAERRGESVKGVRAEFDIKVNASGQGVVGVTAEGGGKKLLSCYRAVTQQWQFPQTGMAYQVNFMHVH